MKKIDTPPRHPERWPYVRHSDETCDWIRVPTPGEVADALAVPDGVSGAAAQEYQLGAIVLLGWKSHQSALESTEARAVYRELHDAGWRIERIAELANAITDAFKQSHTTDADVEEAADFSDATQPNA